MAMPLLPFIITTHYTMLGIAITLLFFGLLLRQKHADATTRIGLALGCCLLAVYLRIGFMAVSVCYELSQPVWFSRYATPILVTFIAFLPALILWSWRLSPILRWKTRTSLRLLVLSCTVGAAVALSSCYFGPDPLTNTTFDGLLVFTKAICLAPAFVSVLKLPLDMRLRAFMKFSGIAYALNIVMNLLRILPWEPSLLYKALLVLILQVSLICGLLGTFVIAARFRYADLFARWTVRITILGALSLIGILSSFYVQSAFKSGSQPLVDVFLSVEFLGLFLLGSLFTDKCIQFVDLHILQRIDIHAETLRLSAAVLQITSREDLFAYLEVELSKGLEVQAVHCVPCSSLPFDRPLIDDSPSTPIKFLSPTGEREWLTDDVLIPVLVVGKIEYYIGVATGAGRQSLNSREVGFLRDVGIGLGMRLQQLEMETSKRQQAIRETSLRQQLTEAELRALRAQVNPHFLFNSLNTIADLVVSDPSTAEQMTLRLSRVFRHVLAQSERQFVSLGEEFTFLRNYLDIEQTRFGETLQISLVLEPEHANIRIPTLLLQPLVENALKHGLSRRGGRRHLSVTSATRKAQVILEVADDGVGFHADALGPRPLSTRRGLGLRNIQDRLKTVYGDRGVLTIDSAPMQGCCVRVSIPLYEVAL